MIGDLLRRQGHEVYPFSNGAEAVPALIDHSPDLVITDLYFDNSSAYGLEVLKRARELVPPAVVIMISGFGSVETAVEAMKHGAFDYIEKPFKVDKFNLSIQRALSYNPTTPHSRTRPRRASSPRKNTSLARSWAPRRRCSRCLK